MAGTPRAGHAGLLGSLAGIRDEELDDLNRGAMIHDIGKIGDPDAILLKPGQLDDDEEAQPTLRQSDAPRQDHLSRID